MDNLRHAFVEAAAAYLFVVNARDLSAGTKHKISR